MSDDITSDLMKKAGDDVTACITRILAIAPAPHLPIGIAGAAAAIGATAAILQRIGTAADAPIPAKDPDCVVLAALLAARMAIDPEGGIKAAYADLECLKSAGRIPQP